MTVVLPTKNGYQPLRCENCGVEINIKLPIEMSKLLELISTFEDLHKNCEARGVT